MKSCPTCNRTFEDTFTFCLVDGAVLSAPYDPQATQRIPGTRNTNPPRTEVWNPTLKASGPIQPPMAPAVQNIPKDSNEKPKVRRSSLSIWIPSGLLVLWLVGIFMGFGGGVVHLLLVAAFIVLITWLIRRRA